MELEGIPFRVIGGVGLKRGVASTRTAYSSSPVGKSKSFDSLVSFGALSLQHYNFC